MKVAIVGMAAGWSEAFATPSDVEVWGINDGYLLWTPKQIARASRWFELHGDTPLTRSRREPDHWDRLAALTIPVYTFFDLPTVPTAIRFPLDAALSHGRDYFACTMAYQIALALAEGATMIGLYGIPLTGAREALVERPCVEWWLGYAAGKGVEVRIGHVYSNGLGQQPYRYALEDIEERTHTYRIVVSHAAHVDPWLTAEEARLDIAERA